LLRILKAPANPGAFCFYAFGEDLNPFGTRVLRKGLWLRISGGMRILLILLTVLSFPVAAQTVPSSAAQIQLSFAPLV